MKKQIMAAVVAVLGITAVQAQEGRFLDNVSLEASYGYNLALSPNTAIETADFSGFNTLQLGATYQINHLWGVRGTYSNTTFNHKDLDNVGVTYNKLTAEATFNVLEAINPSTMPMQQAFELSAHAGLGLNFGKSKVTDATDTMANFQIGIRPQYNVTNRVGIFLDGTYIMNFKQNYGFNGMAIPGEDETTGGYVTGLIGVTVKLGN